MHIESLSLPQLWFVDKLYLHAWRAVFLSQETNPRAQHHESIFPFCPFRGVCCNVLRNKPFSFLILTTSFLSCCPQNADHRSYDMGAVTYHVCNSQLSNSSNQTTLKGTFRKIYLEICRLKAYTHATTYFVSEKLKCSNCKKHIFLPFSPLRKGNISKQPE